MAISFACRCGQEMRAAQSEAGMYARCPRCREVVMVPAGEGITSEQAETLPRVCFACGDALTDDAASHPCPQCGAFYHEDCWQERGRCLAPQCPSRRRWRLSTASAATRFLCPFCGEALAEDKAPCPHCGKALAAIAAASPVGKKVRTSYSGGFSLIAAGLAVVIFLIMPPSELSLLAGLVAGAGLGLGIYAVRDIRRSAESIRGIWAASTGIVLSALAILKFAIDVIAAFF